EGARAATAAAVAAVIAAERSAAAVAEGVGAVATPATDPVLGEPPRAFDDEALEGLRRDAEAAAADLEQARLAHRRAVEQLEQAEVEVAALSAQGERAATELEGLQEVHRASLDGPPPDPDELEWYLVARVAAQRSVSVAGSAPLLLDDPFGGLSEDQVHHLLGRLERVAETIQIIVVSDHPGVETWVGAAGEARAAIVEPSSIAAPALD
ncbi:MAG: hypothetical protein ACO1PW_06595, partial [Actinomycetota bacterium]